MSSRPTIGVRLAIVLSHPTQYYSPWFRWLSENTSLEFRVFYLWDFGVTRKYDPNFAASFEWDVDLLGGYPSEFVPNVAASPGAEHFFGFRNPGLTARLAAWRPGALLIFGYNWASHMRAIAWARLSAVPILFRGDSHLIGRGVPSIPVRLALRVLYAQFASFLYVGDANREYFAAFGVPGQRLFFSPHSVNSALFDPSAPRNRAASEELRSKLGVKSGTKIVLFAGKLVPAKQPMELLEAFVAVNPPDTALVFVGDGPEKGRLKAFASSNVQAAEIHLLPFMNQTEMPGLYLSADIFVLPSRGSYETWGLAVNEAMHMGTPCLVSDRVGCQRDLVIPGETGWVFDPGDPSALRNALAKALAETGSESRRGQIKEAVIRRISGYNYRQTSEGLLGALSALQS